MAPSFSPQPLVPSLRSLLCWCSLIFVPSGNSVCSLQQYHCCELSWQSLTPGLWTLTFPFLFFHTSPCSLDFNFFYPGMDFLLSSSLLNQLPVVQVARPQDNQLDGLRHLIPQTNKHVSCREAARSEIVVSLPHKEMFSTYNKSYYCLNQFWIS